MRALPASGFATSIGYDKGVGWPYLDGFTAMYPLPWRQVRRGGRRHEFARRESAARLVTGGQVAKQRRGDNQWLPSLSLSTQPIPTESRAIDNRDFWTGSPVRSRGDWRVVQAVRFQKPPRASNPLQRIDRTGGRDPGCDLLARVGHVAERLRQIGRGRFDLADVPLSAARGRRDAYADVLVHFTIPLAARY